MNYIDWAKEGNLFEEINKIQSTSFITNYGSNRIDMLYRVKYGNKTIPSSIEKLSITDVANIIIVSCGDNWNSKYTLLKDEILLGVESKQIVEETINDDIMRVSNSNSENKVSAYNEDELVANDSDSNMVNDDTQKETNRTTTTINTNLNAIKTQLELLDSNFLDTVLKDVSKLVSLSIY